MTRPKYRVHVWKDRWKFGDHQWLAAVREGDGPIVLPPLGSGLDFPTHAEAVAAGLDWANELNTREQEDA